MDEIYLKKLAERARQDDTLLGKLADDVRERVEEELAQSGND